jgi:hypothetical protein
LDADEQGFGGLTRIGIREQQIKKSQTSDSIRLLLIRENPARPRSSASYFKPLLAPA